ncbi:hypothetical protein [Streptomyces pactum]|uniref:hypothetical protein n=1 Tax=Streptomyces pactum TaxID=68249 RepID=UPI0036FCC5FD
MRTELNGLRERVSVLDHHRELCDLADKIVRSHRAIEEAIRAGVAELGQDSRGAFRRQDLAVEALDGIRDELRRLRQSAGGPRDTGPPGTDAADHPPGADAPDHGDGSREPRAEAATGAGERPGPDPGVPGGTGTPEEPPTGACPEEPADGGDPAGHGPVPRTAAPPYRRTGPGTDQQRESMENSGPGGEAADEESELALRRAIEAAYHHGEAPAPGSPAASPATVAGPPEDARVTHGVLLLKAAGVASAELVAHRDTWEWLTVLAVAHGHFRTPPAVAELEGGRVRTVLSGRSLIALLIELWKTRSGVAPLEAEWALATAAYHRIGAQLAEVSGQGETIRIVLDDGLPTEPDS